MQEREIERWITVNGKHIPIYADEPDDSKQKERQIKQNEEEAGEKNSVDYRISHQPGNPLKYPDEVATVDKIANGKFFPKDIIQNARDYLPDFDDYPDAQKIVNIWKQAQNNPNMIVTIYRGAPSKGVLHQGDWVTLSEAYAKEYAEGGAYSEKWSGGKSKAKVYSYQVRVGDLSFDGDSFWEYGYWGNTVK